MLLHDNRSEKAAATTTAQRLWPENAEDAMGANEGPGSAWYGMAGRYALSSGMPRPFPSAPHPKWPLFLQCEKSN